VSWWGRSHKGPGGWYPTSLQIESDISTPIFAHTAASLLIEQYDIHLE